MNETQTAERTGLRVTLRLEPQASGTIVASVVEFPECWVEAATREAAIEGVQAALLERLAHVETIFWNVPLPVAQSLNDLEEQSVSPWIKFAGMFQDDPDFAEIAANIRAEREIEDETEVDPSVYSLEGRGN
jgi:predicted RNase H-like HicB family nuclease